MPRPPRQSGFTLLEVVVAIAILAIVAGTVLPLGSSQRRTDQTERVLDKLARIEQGMTRYRRDRGAFPASLSDATFLGPYFAAGIENDGIRDDWSPTGAALQYQVASDVAHVWSVGPVPISGPPDQQSYRIDVLPSEVNPLVVANPVQTTRDLMTLIVNECYRINAAYVRSTLNHSYYRRYRALSYSRTRLPTTVPLTDAWGTTLQGHYFGFFVWSAGPDRRFNTTDDIRIP